MKFCAIFVFACVTYTLALDSGKLEKYNPYYLALNTIFKQCSKNKTLDLDVSKVDVYFYDFSKNNVKTFPIKSAAKDILNIPDFDNSRKLIIYISGHTTTISKSEDRIRKAFRDLSNSYLIILDDSSYTDSTKGERIKSFLRSVEYAYYVGKAIAGMLTDLKKGGIPAKNMHCIGYSLGGQIMGYTGQVFYENTGDKLWRVTALDPAGPCFSDGSIEDQVRAGVAEYVEIYHCNAGGYGTNRILGDINFFLNKKGRVQPDCETPFLLDLDDVVEAADCNHMTCVEVWTATVKHHDWFSARKCDPRNKFKEDQSSGNEVALAGFWNPGNATGVYCFSTEGYDMDL